MRCRWRQLTAAALAACCASGGVALSQTQPITEADCKKLRERLAEHARLSAGVRSAVAAQAARYPASPRPAAPVPAPAAPAARGEAIRTRLAQIPDESRRLQDERTGAIVRFELGRAAQLQTQIQALETERANLEKELAGLPAAPAGQPPAAPPPQAAPLPASPSQPVSDVDRIPCQEMPAAHDSAVRTRQRELGAREGLAGAIPLTALKGQTAEQIARELAGQFAPWPQAAAQVGLLDQDGDGRLDAFVDAPGPNSFRLYRQRPDGGPGIDVFAVPTPGATPGYDEMTRRLDEASLRQARRLPADLLPSRPAAPVRVLAEAGEFARAQGFFLAGNFAEAARVEGGGARTLEFQNFRGETVRALEVIAPMTGGVALRRLVVLPLPNNEEQWEETVTLVKPTSYWRTEAEVRVNVQRRTAAGAPVGNPTAAGPYTFSVDR